jgi:hypothetical protein
MKLERIAFLQAAWHERQDRRSIRERASDREVSNAENSLHASDYLFHGRFGAELNDHAVTRLAHADGGEFRQCLAKGDQKFT